MGLETVETFVDSLERLDVGWTRTGREGLEAVLDEVSERPAVGTPPGNGVSLPEWVEDDPTAADLETAATGITGAGIGIADYGSVVLPSDAAGTEPVSLFADRHVAVLPTEDVVADMPAAFEWLGGELRTDGGSAIIATGPSATADMGALVTGAHGPKEVHVVLLEDGSETGGDDQ